MISPGLQNPFLVHKVDDTVSLPPGDVPELHAGVLARCEQARAQVQATGQSMGLLVFGEAGSGKSHMLAQLRQQIAADSKAVLVAVPLRGAYAGKLWRHVRRQMVIDLVRQYPPPANGDYGLARILRNRFPSWAATAANTTGGLLDWILGRSNSAQDLRPLLDDLARRITFDYNLRKVLPVLATPDLTALAHDWLRGEQLGADDLGRLGLPPEFPDEQEQEANAREVVLSLLRLAGDKTTLIITFDEVEALQAGTGDEGVLRQFTTLATGLLAETGPRVVLTCIRPDTLRKLQKAVEVSNMQKIGQVVTVIPNLTWEQTVRVALARLEAEKTCHDARLGHPHNPFWPLTESFLQKLFEDNRRSLTPRHLIRACANEFEGPADDLPSLTPITEPGEPEPRIPAPPTPPPRTPSEEAPDPPPLAGKFTHLWERQRTRYIAKPQGIQFDNVMALALPWLVELLGLPYVREQAANSRLGDINLVFHPTLRGPSALGVSLCNQAPNILWRRLDRVLKQWQAAKSKELGGLIVLRSALERTTAGAQARLANLKAAGVTVLWVDRQQLAELAAFQEMLTAAQVGDLTYHGKPINPADYDHWAREHLSAAAKEFLDAVFELGGRKGPAPVAAGTRPAKAPARK